MTTNNCWIFEETCPSCDESRAYHFRDVDEHGFIVCKYCGCKMHACSLCDNRDSCNDCDEHDASKSRWRSDDMTEYMRYRLQLSAEKQAVYSQYISAQASIIRALYDDSVDVAMFKTTLQLLCCPEKEIKPEFEDDRIYIDKTGSAWFKHRGYKFHILKLGRLRSSDGEEDIGKLIVSSEYNESFNVIPDCCCDYFDVTDDDDAWLNVQKWLLPGVDDWINSLIISQIDS